MFIPVAECAVDEGLNPIFPPLEPGGDYWDLSFLQSSLQSLQRRGRFRLLERLGLGAISWVGRKPIEWGKGGPACWPDVKPYFTPVGSEDQKGFRIFDWYMALSKRELGRPLPLLVLRAGSLPHEFINNQTGLPDFLAHAESNLAAASVFEMQTNVKNMQNQAPEEVLDCCFWLLASRSGSATSNLAWFPPDGEPLPVVNGFYRLAAKSSLFSPELQVEQVTTLQSKANVRLY